MHIALTHMWMNQIRYMRRFFQKTLCNRPLTIVYQLDVLVVTRVPNSNFPIARYSVTPHAADFMRVAVAHLQREMPR